MSGWARHSSLGISTGVGSRAGERTSTSLAWTSRPPGALGFSTTRPRTLKEDSGRGSRIPPVTTWTTPLRSLRRRNCTLPRSLRQCKKPISSTSWPTWAGRSLTKTRILSSLSEAPPATARRGGLGAPLLGVIKRTRAHVGLKSRGSLPLRQAAQRPGPGGAGPLGRPRRRSSPPPRSGPSTPPPAPPG
ncbi:hypothetical protein TO73_2409 [Thermus aquaticus Y51MC23]|uniref:Uncharacterized protein n=1 Tax=Thermus aquaticus (strain ATCC BAA-2747 / Y51MC23) TaxID=498848 RepID=A0ABM5VMI5_THEA5|nr:hypothetical protein TO73_2409 [Thermus aquaticus Y51MC23]